MRISMCGFAVLTTLWLVFGATADQASSPSPTVEPQQVQAQQTAQQNISEIPTKQLEERLEALLTEARTLQAYIQGRKDAELSKDAEKKHREQQKGK